LWFDDKAEEAVNFYTSIFKNSKIKSVTHYGEAGAEVSGKPKGAVMTVTFELEGQEFIALIGGPHFTFSPALSFIAEKGTSYNPPVKRKIFSCDFEETENKFSFGDTSPASPFGLPIDSTNLSLRRTVDLIVTFIRCAPLERDHPSSLI
jgi:hypothetical protein